MRIFYRLSFHSYNERQMTMIWSYVAFDIYRYYCVPKANRLHFLRTHLYFFRVLRIESVKELLQLNIFGAFE